MVMSAFSYFLHSLYKFVYKGFGDRCFTYLYYIGH